MTTTQIVDNILPLTKADNKCGFQKAKKLKERAYLVMLINYYREGQKVQLPEDVKMLLNGSNEALATI